MHIAAAKITESKKTIMVRIGPALLTISGDARDMLDADTVASQIAGLDDEDTVCALLGMGFDLRGVARKPPGSAARRAAPAPAPMQAA